MKKKLLITLSVVACALLLVAGSIAGTIAYLTSNDTVTNTFTVGHVKITMDETDVDVYGKKETDTRVKGNTYKLLPGHSYIKDPVIHVTKGSEECWLFVKVVDQLSDIEASETVVEQLTANGWIELAGVENVWYHAKVDARDVDADVDVEVFENFNVRNDATVSTYTGKTIVVTAYAIQADGFDTAEKAWTAASSEFGN